MYYENYILINIEIPNFEDIKKKYFDNEGNKIVLLKDNYSIQSPFEYFTPVMNVDPDGHFSMAVLLVISVIAAIGGGGVQLASNAASGKTGSELWRGVIGAAVGAGVNALLLCVTMGAGTVASAIISGGTSAIMQTNVDMLERAIRGEETNSQIYWSNYLKNAAVNIAGNLIGSKLIKTNAGGFQPKKVLSAITKPYGQKILAQSFIGSVISGASNIVMNYTEKLLEEM